MLEQELVSLIDKIKEGGCEGQKLELKKAKSGFPKFYDTLSSFSNQNDGGIIIFGIDEINDNEICGVYEAQDLLHKISEQCKQMQPEVRGVTTTCIIEGKTVVSLEVPTTDVFQRPVYYKGAGIMKGSYIRVGEADEPMSDYEIYSYEAFKKHLRDDIRVVDEADISHLDTILLRKYIDALRLNRPNTQNLTDEEICTLMGLIKEGKPTITALMCFSKYPQAICPQLCVTAVVVPGYRMGETSDDGQRFIDNKKIEGTIPQMVAETLNFVVRNMGTGIKFVDGKRIDASEYPLTAVREAIVNALVHRDYSVYTEGMPVRIEMYKDRLEIVNAGGVYGAINVDKLGRVHADTRNKTLVSVLETLKQIENRYSGIPTIRKELKESGLPEPLFVSEKGLFKTVFFNGKGADFSELKGNSGNLIEFCKVPRSRKEIAEFLGKTQYYAMKKYVEPLISSGLLLYTIPDKVKSKEQKIVAK